VMLIPSRKQNDIFFTNQYLTADQKKKYIRFCFDSLDAELIPQDIEALRSQLDSALKAIRESYLHIKNDAVELGTRDSSRMPIEVRIIFPNKDGLTYAQISRQNRAPVAIPTQTTTTSTIDTLISLVLPLFV
jgi:hypothetical protein